MKLLKVYEENKRGRRQCLVYNEEIDKNVRMYYYQYIWIMNNGPIPVGYVIHHIDGNHKNDDISNLTLMERVEHSRWHSNNMSDETKKKIALSLLDNKHNLGRKASKETREKMSKVRTNKPKKKGYKLSKETREKMSKARMGNKINLGRKHTDEQKQKIAEAIKNKPKEKCPWCGLITNSKRWHFNNCKQKQE